MLKEIENLKDPNGKFSKYVIDKYFDDGLKSVFENWYGKEKGRFRSTFGKTPKNFDKKSKIFKNGIIYVRNN